MYQIMFILCCMVRASLSKEMIFYVHSIVPLIVCSHWVLPFHMSDNADCIQIIA